MVWVAVDAFPHSSVAVHVLVTEYEPSHVPGVVTSLKVNANTLPQISVAVAVANEGTAGQLIVVGAGSGSMTGATVSVTMIVCDVVEVFPHSSTAVHIFSTEYDPAHAPGVVIFTDVSVTVLQASVADGVANDGAPSVQLTVVTPGNGPRTGAVLSSTLMVCEAVELFPHESVAVHVLVTEYSPVQDPGVVTSLCVQVTVPPHASFAIGVAKTGNDGHSIVDGPGSGSITGATVSVT